MHMLIKHGNAANVATKSALTYSGRFLKQAGEKSETQQSIRARIKCPTYAVVNQFEEQSLVLASRKQSREEDEIERTQKLAKIVTPFSSSNIRLTSVRT